MLAFGLTGQHKGRMYIRFCPRRILAILLLGSALPAFSAENPFLGQWALTIPNGGAGWLGVEEKNGQLRGSMMWEAGSVEPVASVKVDANQITITRKHEVERKDAQGKKVKYSYVETISGKVTGDTLHLTTSKPKPDGGGEESASFEGRRQPPIPAAPDLSMIKFGEPISLFNGRDLTGWRLTNPNAVSGWGVKDGDLINNPVQEEGKHKNYGNLRTDQEFQDFNLKLEVLISKGQNSGVYVRGMYEVQVADTYGKPLDSHNMGAVYSRITPSKSAEKPPGEWQTMEITFVARHITVVLNGARIIDNQPVLGCTGGALWSDVTRPGPIYLQGDHTGIEYRNLVLRPVVR